MYREDTPTAGMSALVFRRGDGEHSIVSRDLDIGPMSVIQFDVSTIFNNEEKKR